MKRPSPLIQMTFALVGLCGTLVLLADLFFGILPDRSAQAMHLRRNISEALAVQVAALLQEQDQKTLQRTLDGVAARTEGVRSLAVRRADGSIVKQAGDHASHWRAASDDASNPEQVTVPLNANGARWGSFEIAFGAPAGHPVWRFLTQPMMVLLFFISAAGTLVFGLYMRRTLQHLDPAAVIPERVQGAFDAMAEGVVVLDARGRVLLSNKAFRELHSEAAAVTTGNTLSTLPWLAKDLPPDPGLHPWQRAMAQRASSAGHTLQMGAGSADARQLVINCAPIADPGGHVRGCVVTFDDVSQLHQTNLALQETMAELSASREVLQQQNVELERLATRDPMTGCLNRRAFFAAFEPLFARSREERGALSCLMVDIDHFKSVNDTHGHAVGDVVIQALANKLLESARTGDLVCRYGGEEFCIVLPGMGAADANAFAERLRARIERECGPGVREVPNMRVTASLGLCTLSGDLATAAALVDRADQALYGAKRAGRNRVGQFALGGAANQRAVADTGADRITGCLLPIAFQAKFDALLRGAQTRGTLLSAVKFGFDPSRAPPDEPGRAASDATLRTLADVLRDCARPQDLLVRLDAEHFGVVAPELSIGDALLFAEQLRARVEREFAAAGAPGLTISAGVDSLPANASGAPTLIERAGKALLRARREGANRVNRFAPGPSASLIPTLTSGPGSSAHLMPLPKAGERASQAALES